MWIFTQYGFFSAVSAFKRDENGQMLVDRMNVTVRARNETHLVMLKDRFKQLEPFAISVSNKSDYLARILVPKGVWVSVLAELAFDIYYPNFKDFCEEREELDPHYTRTLHDVWGVMYDYQDRVLLKNELDDEELEIKELDVSTLIKKEGV